MQKTTLNSHLATQDSSGVMETEVLAVVITSVGVPTIIEVSETMEVVEITVEVTDSNVVEDTELSGSA